MVRAPLPPTTSSAAPSGDCEEPTCARHRHRDQGSLGMRSDRRTVQPRRSSPRCRCRVTAARTSPRAGAPGARSSRQLRRRARARDARSRRPRLEAAGRAPRQSRVGRRRQGQPASRELVGVEVADRVQQCGLEPREGEVEPGDPRDRKRVGIRVTGGREPVELPSSGVAEPEEPRALVERLTGGIVERRADHLERPPLAARRGAACGRRSQGGR